MTLTADQQEQVESPTPRLAYLVDIAFPSGTVYLCLAGRRVLANGKVYLPGTLLRSPSGMTETLDLTARRVTFECSGADDDFLAKARDDDWAGVAVNCWDALFNENWKLAAPLVPSGKFKLSEAPIARGGDGGIVVEFSAENRSLLYRRNRAALGTPESQRRRVSGDTGLDNVRATAEQVVEWGGIRQTTGGGGGAGFPEDPERRFRIRS